MATATTYKINPAFNDKDRARLESKNYERAYTDVPNSVLPETMRNALGVVYKALTGEELSPTDHSFTVRADQSGIFKALYCPTVFSTEEGTLIIRWGDQDIPLLTSGGKIATEKSSKNTKFSFKEEKIGKYNNAVLSVAVNEGGCLYSLPIPVRSTDFENPVTSELLDLVLEDAIGNLQEIIALAPDPSKRGDGGERMQGDLIKVAELPVGEYEVISYRVKEGGEYGPNYFMQVCIPEPFSAMARKQVDGEWKDVEVEVQDFAIVRPNTALKKILSAEPIITPESPARLKVLEHGVFNGFATAKCTLKCASFVEDPESFALDWD